MAMSEKKKTLSIQRGFSNTNQLSLIVIQITFEGICDKGDAGDIAIDDVSLIEGICAGKLTISKILSR